MEGIAHTNFIDTLVRQLAKHSEENALWIAGHYYTYRQLAGFTASIIEILDPTGQPVAIVTHDTPQTYAAILSSLISGNGFVPVSPTYPPERARGIIEQAGCQQVLSVSGKDSLINEDIIFTDISQISNSSPFVAPMGSPDTGKTACILFTSGSTGKPKGVPMTYTNINASIDAFFALGYGPQSGSRCLQMFEFTFDMSMLSYLPAFLVGACVYSVVDDKFRFLNAFRIISEFALNFAVFVPSTLAFMQKYFAEMHFPALKCCLVGGEPFQANLAMAWSKCAPNARIINISGPTETTMACMGYEVPIGSPLKQYNGVLIFGRPWKNTLAIVIDEQLNPLPAGMKGELCFAGKNVMDGYLNMPERNAICFFNYQGQRWYRTGDGAFFDEEGDFFTCGRIDHQVKIQGYRVEPGEIEVVAREVISAPLVIVPYKRGGAHISLRLFIADMNVDKNLVYSHLKTMLAPYMLPDEITLLGVLPVNDNGKIDRNYLKQLLETNET